MEPFAELKKLGFYVIRDNALAAEVKADNRGRKIAVLITKTKPTLFERIGRTVHGIGLSRFSRYLSLRKSAGVDVYLAFYERQDDCLMMQEIEELNLRRVPCFCASCRLGQFDRCKMEAGGMVFFDRALMLDCAKQRNRLARDIGTEQLDMF